MFLSRSLALFGVLLFALACGRAPSEPPTPLPESPPAGVASPSASGDEFGPPPAPEDRELAMQASAAPSSMRMVAGVMARSPDLPASHVTDNFGFVDEAGFSSVTLAPLSTFSADVDTASYTLVRRMLTIGRLPPPDAVRLEELLNYFDYAYPPPAGDDPLSIFTALAPHPWAPDRLLLQIGLSTEPIPSDHLPATSLVFLIDVSGSMSTHDRLPLVRWAMALLVDQLRPQDQVSIVVYAGAAGVVLETVSGDRKSDVHHALAELQAGGSTAGAAGIHLAYELAHQQFLPDGHNRVILVTDGDFNVGVSTPGELVGLVERQADSGVYLTVLGVGLGNLQDETLGRLADSGNGVYHYLDSLAEARRALVAQHGSVLSAVADDVKVQLEFNPARVERYRLLGYRDRRLAPDDFANVDIDAGDLGAGHSVTALYELVPGTNAFVTAEPLRYQEHRLSDLASTDELLRVSVRYLRPGGTDSQLLSVPVLGADLVSGDPPPQLLLASAVVEFGFALRRSSLHPGVSLDAASERAARSGLSGGGRLADFLELVAAASELLAVQLESQSPPNAP